MRMWMINPIMLCRKHLLGEHGEIHKFRHNFVKQHSIAGRMSPVIQIEPLKMKLRHDELVEEMLRRGYNHNSPYILPDLSYLPEEFINAKVNIGHNIVDLMARCGECRSLIIENSNKAIEEIRGG
jgi:hypothetical protein